MAVMLAVLIINFLISQIKLKSCVEHRVFMVGYDLLKRLGNDINDACYGGHLEKDYRLPLQNRFMGSSFVYNINLIE